MTDTERLKGTYSQSTVVIRCPCCHEEFVLRQESSAEVRTALSDAGNGEREGMGRSGHV